VKEIEASFEIFILEYSGCLIGVFKLNNYSAETPPPNLPFNRSKHVG
jgi:hypothetical protein